MLACVKICLYPGQFLAPSPVIPIQPNAPQLLNWLRAQTPNMLNTLEALTRIESPTSDPASQTPMFAALRTQLNALDYDVRVLPAGASGGALYARPRMRSPNGNQLILGHVDTVWAHGTLASMPFAIDGDTLTGPGTYDMKGGIVQLLWALQGLRQQGMTPAFNPIILLNSDEEIGSPHSTHWVKRLARISKRCFVLEPSLGPSGKLKNARKGVGHYTVEIRGRAAHAGLDPEKGISATVELSHVIQALHALNAPGIGRSVNIGEMSGGTRRNVVPAAATAQVDIRVMTRADEIVVNTAIAQISATVPGAQVRIHGGFVKHPMEKTPASQALWRSAQQAAKQLGIPIEADLAGGCSDGNTAALFCPVLDGLGAVGGGAHARTEHMSVQKMAERAALLAMLLCA